MNNFYFYRLEGSTRHVFLAWDEDNAFFRDGLPADDAARRERPDAQGDAGARAARRVTTRLCPRLRRRRPSRPMACRGSSSRCGAQMDLIAQPIRDDTFMPYSVVDHEAARASLVDFARNRSRIVTEQVPQ